MAKININSIELRENCIPQLKDTISSLKKAYDYFDYFDIPLDFSKRQKLKNVRLKIKNIINDLEYAKNWIVDSNNDYNGVIEKLNEKNSKLSTSTIKTRNNII